MVKVKTKQIKTVALQKTGKTSTKKSAVPESGTTKQPVSKKKELSREQKLFLQLLHSYPDGALSIIDKKFNFVITGGALHKALSSNPFELIGNRIYPKLPEEVRQVIKTQLKKVFKGEHISAFELPKFLKDQFYIMDAFPVNEQDGTIVYAGVIIRNITFLKKAEEELKESLRKERELGEMKTRFITIASHEFRTPLSAVLTSVQLLKKYKSTDSEAKIDKHISRIISSVQRLTDILDDFQTVGKIQEENVLVCPAKLNIKEMINQFIAEFDHAKKDEYKIVYTHKGKESVELDPGLFKIILSNLLSNAMKFSDEGTQINIITQWIDGKLQLSIEDKGIGIPADFRSSIFQRFYRASNALNIQGTGMGLHIVKKYVELMNGTIEYESKLGKGTSFILTFGKK